MFVGQLFYATLRRLTPTHAEKCLSTITDLSVKSHYSKHVYITFLHIFRIISVFSELSMNRVCSPYHTTFWLLIPTFPIHFLISKSTSIVIYSLTQNKHLDRAVQHYTDNTCLYNPTHIDIKESNSVIRSIINTDYASIYQMTLFYSLLSTLTSHLHIWYPHSIDIILLYVAL